MDNRKKVFIALGIIGLVLICAGSVMGGGIASIPTMFQSYDMPAGAVALSEVAPTDIKAVELNLSYATLSIKAGQDFDLSSTGCYDSYVKDGIFYAGAGDTTHYATILGTKVNAPSKLVCGYTSYVLVIPSAAELDHISINTNHCDITCDSSLQDRLDLNMNGGELTINTDSQTESEDAVTVE